MFSEWDSKGVWEPEAHAVTDRTLDQSPLPSLISTKNLREMKDHQQTVREMMKDRAGPVWHPQTAQNKTSFLFCVCEEKVEGVRGDVGPEPGHRIRRGVIRQHPAKSILQKAWRSTHNLLTHTISISRTYCKVFLVNPHYSVWWRHQNKNRFRGISSHQCIQLEWNEMTSCTSVCLLFSVSHHQRILFTVNCDKQRSLIAANAKLMEWVLLLPAQFF